MCALCIDLVRIANTTRNIVEALYNYESYHPVPFSRDPPTGYSSEPALRIWRKEMAPTYIGNIMLLKDSLIEFPRPYYVCRRDWAEHYLNREAPHLPNQVPPTRAAFERLILSKTPDDQYATDIISSAEGLWPVEVPSSKN